MLVVEKNNNVVDIKTSNGKIAINKRHEHMTLEERAKATGLNLEVDRNFDWGEPVGREKW